MKINRLRVPVAIAFAGFRAYVYAVTEAHPSLKLFPRHEALRSGVVVCGEHGAHEGHHGRCAVCDGYAMRVDEFYRRAA